MEPLKVLREHSREIERRFGVRRIGVFGSAARDEMDGQSDVDVLVDFESGEATFDHYMDLKFFLEDQLGRDVDLVTRPSLKERLRDRVLSQAQYV